MTNSRPFGVMLIATLMLIVGVVRSILGILFLSGNPYIKSGFMSGFMSGFQQTLPPDTPDLGAMEQYSLMWVGIVFLVLGLLGLLMSYGMFTFKGWAWLWTIVVASLNLVGVFVGLLQGLRGIDALISIAIFVLVVYYLSTTPVRRAFGMLPHR